MTTKNKMVRIKQHKAGRIENVSMLLERLGHAYVALERAARKAP